MKIPHCEMPSTGFFVASRTSAAFFNLDIIKAAWPIILGGLGNTVLLSLVVLPLGLLGGLIVKVGSKMIDNSLRTKLNNLKVVMKGMG